MGVYTVVYAPSLRTICKPQYPVATAPRFIVYTFNFIQLWFVSFRQRTNVWTGWHETEYGHPGMAIWLATKWTWSNVASILGYVSCCCRLSYGTCYSEGHQFLPRFSRQGLAIVSNSIRMDVCALCVCVLLLFIFILPFHIVLPRQKDSAHRTPTPSDSSVAVAVTAKQTFTCALTFQFHLI